MSLLILCFSYLVIATTSTKLFLFSYRQPCNQSLCSVLKIRGSIEMTIFLHNGWWGPIQNQLLTKIIAIVTDRDPIVKRVDSANPSDKWTLYDSSTSSRLFIIDIIAHPPSTTRASRLLVQLFSTLPTRISSRTNLTLDTPIYLSHIAILWVRNAWNGTMRLLMVHYIYIFHLFLYPLYSIPQPLPSPSSSNTHTTPNSKGLWPYRLSAIYSTSQICNDKSTNSTHIQSSSSSALSSLANSLTASFNFFLLSFLASADFQSPFILDASRSGKMTLKTSL